MALLKPIENGRMYPGWWRWNPIGGCEHGCSYCYLLAMQKRFGKDMMTPCFKEEYLNDDLGSGRKIFVCSSGDMWGKWVKPDDIKRVLEHCARYPDNEYMFLTKNPKGYMSFDELNYLNCILGATVETDDTYVWDGVCSNPFVPDGGMRMTEMWTIRRWFRGLRTMISVEPIMKCTKHFAERLVACTPDRVYVGVDSGKNGLLEPTADELRGLIAELRQFTDVRLKKGIARILKARL